LSDTDSVNQLV